MSLSAGPATLGRSIVRRSAIVLGFTLPGMVLNLLLLYVAAELMQAEAFGVLYVAISAANTLVAPSHILTLFYTRHFVEAGITGGSEQIVHAFRRFVRRIWLWGLPISALVFVAIGIAGLALEITAFGVVILIVLIAFGAYLGDSVRAALQSLQRFVALGAYGLVWMALRFVLGTAAILGLGTAWAALCGLFLAGVAVFLGGYRHLTHGRPAPAEPATDPALGTLPAIALSFGFLIAIFYLDVMLAYILLDGEALGTYSASSVIPKGIIIATVPILQVFFPTFLFSRQETVRLKSALLLKGLAATLVIAGAVIALLLAAPDAVCGGSYGISRCDAPVMVMIAIGTLPLCILRVLVVVQFARGREWHPVWLALPTLLFVAWAGVRGVEVAELASSFAVFSYALLLYYAVISNPLALYRRLREGAADSALADR